MIVADAQNTRANLYRMFIVFIFFCVVHVTCNHFAVCITLWPCQLVVCSLRAFILSPCMYLIEFYALYVEQLKGAIKRNEYAAVYS